MPSESYTLATLVIQWLRDNDYTYEEEDYVDFILLYVNAPSMTRSHLSRLMLGRGSWATNLLDNSGEKRGIMVLKDKVQIGVTTPHAACEVVEIQAWDPTLFDQLKAYLS